MTSIKKTSRRKPGRPRKYGQGRINATVRFTPERYAELRAQADANGRSVSEQVEYLVNSAIYEQKLVANFRRELEADVASSAEALRAASEKQMKQLEAEHAKRMEQLEAEVAKRIEQHEAELERLKPARSLEDTEERFFKIVEAAMASAIRAANKGENK